MKIADSQLIANLPISRANIAAAERIFGPNLGALKGKTTKRVSIPVEGRINGMPAGIMERHQQVTLAMDIMFVNKIPFLMTMSRRLHISTRENITNQQVPTVANAIKRVLQLYPTDVAFGLRPYLLTQNLDPYMSSSLTFHSTCVHKMNTSRRLNGLFALSRTESAVCKRKCL
jgi:hypothetical protein